MTQTYGHTATGCQCVFAYLFLCTFTGTVGQSWPVSYGLQNVCVLQGTSVVLPCEFSHPKDLEVTQAYWFRGPASHSDISSIERYRNRVHYLGDKVRNCSLKLSSLTTADTGHFRFRVITNVTSKRWTYEPGVRVKVTGMILCDRYNTFPILFLMDTTHIYLFSISLELNNNFHLSN